MEWFNVLVRGSASGMNIASAAVDQGFRTTVVDSGPMSGAID
jgi:5-formaminoimidazole-4-carboxamide-1-beta-D-ribofuranosyl 5'-monophosphate synthetase